MKNKCSKELKLLIAATALLLTIFTAVLVNQMFEGEPDDVEFVYNLAPAETKNNVNL